MWNVAEFSATAEFIVDNIVIWFIGSKPKSGSDSDAKSSSSVSQLRKLPLAAGSSMKREASAPSGIGLVIKKPRIASQMFTALGRAVEADRRASPTTQVYLYEEIAAEGVTFCINSFHVFLFHECQWLLI